jgi:hypothetical protein
MATAMFAETLEKPTKCNMALFYWFSSEYRAKLES